MLRYGKNKCVVKVFVSPSPNSYIINPSAFRGELAVNNFRITRGGE